MTLAPAIPTAAAAALAAFPAIVVSDLVRYLLGAGLVALLLLALGPVAKTRRIQARRAGAADIRRELLASMSTVLIFALNGAMILMLATAGVFSISDAMPGWTLGAAEVLGLILLHDTSFYWTHRAQHHRRVFAAHRLHHLSRAPTPWAAYAFGPVDALVQALFLTIVLVLVPLHAISIFLFLVHMILRNAMGHAGHELMPPGFTRHWLGRWLTTTTHHDLHHSEGRHNFGLYFTWWDRMMGTEHPDYHARFEAAAKPWRRVPAAALLTLMLAAGLGTPEPARAADAVEGRWITPGFGSVVEVRHTRDTLEARVRWLWAPGPARPGQPLFEAFTRSGGQWHGRIFNPEDGRSYRATITPEGGEWLVVRGCIGPLCRNQRWRRLDTMLASLPSAP
jgi:sterol desaturase/sphingolipid hydroxylase (fatty acid hydroxylase superfamily)